MIWNVITQVIVTNTLYETFLMFLLGYGLVQFPKSLWMQSDLDYFLLRTQMRASIDFKSISESQLSVSLVVSDVLKTKAEVSLWSHALQFFCFLPCHKHNIPLSLFPSISCCITVGSLLFFHYFFLSFFNFLWINFFITDSSICRCEAEWCNGYNRIRMSLRISIFEDRESCYEQEGSGERVDMRIWDGVKDERSEIIEEETRIRQSGVEKEVRQGGVKTEVRIPSLP